MAARRHQADLRRHLNCPYGCHQLGNKATRTISPALGTFKSSEEAWERRIQSGQAMTAMAGAIGREGPKFTLANLAKWTDRIAAGELPFAKPERPQGIERNVVITEWDWADPKAYLHDQVSTDKRNPTVNAYGKHYGATEESREYFPVLDPKENRASTVAMPLRDPEGVESSKEATMGPSIYWGDEAIWDARASTHSLIMDERGDVWLTSRVSKPDNPAAATSPGRRASSSPTRPATASSTPSTASTVSRSWRSPIRRSTGPRASTRRPASRSTTIPARTSRPMRVSAISRRAPRSRRSARPI